MKNLIFTIVFIAAISSSNQSFGQTAAAPVAASPTVVETQPVPQLKLASSKGDFNLGLGIAFIEEDVTPAILFAEYSFAQNFSFGLHFAYTSLEIDSDLSINIFSTELRASYHFGELMSLGSNFDLYAGVGAAHTSVSLKSSYSGDSLDLESENDFGAHLGARVYIGSVFGIYAEAVHMSDSYLHLGLTVKF